MRPRLLGRLGRYTATHARGVFITWALIALVLGFLAPRVEHTLSGAGWEATGSQSVQARKLIDARFAGQGAYALTAVVHSTASSATDPAFRMVLARVRRTLRADHAVRGSAATTRSRDGHTVLVQAGAARGPNEMVRAAERLRPKLTALSAGGVGVQLTGAAAMWSDFNTANRDAMLKSEVISWPVTLAILLVAFGSLVAAGLPLMLTMVGLVSAAGLLYAGSLISPISIWAMNFALMFALALGIDYALFVVHRFRGTLFGSGMTAQDAVVATMDTAGRAVLFSGLTVLVSLTAVMFVPSPAFRSMTVGIMLAVVFVLAATLTLLPAVLAKLGPRVDRLGLKWVHAGEHRSPRFEAWAQRLWRHPAAYGAVALALLVALCVPVLKMKTAMPSIKVVPAGDSSRVGYGQVQAAFGPGATGPLQIVAPAAQARQVARVLRSDPGIGLVLPVRSSEGSALVTAVPRQDPSSGAVGRTIDRLRDALPARALVGGAVAENHDLEAALKAKTPLAIGVVLALGFV